MPELNLENLKQIHADGRNFLETASTVIDDLIREVEQLRSDRDQLYFASKKFLASCRCVDIHHHGFGPAFDAALSVTRLVEQHIND